MKLYIYEHCPFTARVRFVAAKQAIDLDIVAIDYDDDKTTTAIMGSKQVPVLVKDDGEATAESLDIIQYFLEKSGSSENNIPSKEVLEWQSAAFFPLQQVGYPRWSNLPLKEFITDSSKTAWRAKKETEELNFDRLIEETPAIAKTVEGLIIDAEKLLKKETAKEIKLVDEAIIFSILRGFVSAPEIKWTPFMKEWIENASKETGISLLK